MSSSWRGSRSSGDVQIPTNLIRLLSMWNGFIQIGKWFRFGQTSSLDCLGLWPVQLLTSGDDDDGDRNTTKTLIADGWMGGLVLDSNIIQSSSFPPPSSLRAFELPSKIIKLQWKFFFSILWNPFPGRSVAVAGSFMSPSFFSSCRTVAVDGLGAAPATD